MDSIIDLPVRDTHKLYALYECIVGIDGVATVIYVGVERLTDVYGLSQPNHNSEWNKIFPRGVDGMVRVRIIRFDADKHVLRRESQQYMKTLPELPRCNLRGVRTQHGLARAVWSSYEGGTVFRSQSEASHVLGIPQASISRCVRGMALSTHGYTFREARPDDRITAKESH